MVWLSPCRTRKSKTLDVEAENYNGGGVVNDQFNRREPEGSLGLRPAACFGDFVQLRFPQTDIEPLCARGGRRLDYFRSRQYQNGGLIAVPAAQNNLSTLLFRSTLFNRVPGVPLYTQDPNGHVDPNKQFLLNPAAWSDPAAGQWGYSAPYYSDYRGRRSPKKMPAWAGFSTSGKR